MINGKRIAVVMLPLRMRRRLFSSRWENCLIWWISASWSTATAATKRSKSPADWA
jgi:hypothetical protein